MRINIQIVSDDTENEVGTELERDLFDVDGEPSDGVEYHDAVEQCTTALRAALFAHYGYDKPSAWNEPVDLARV